MVFLMWIGMEKMKMTHGPSEFLDSQFENEEGRGRVEKPRISKINPMDCRYKEG